MTDQPVTPSIPVARKPGKRPDLVKILEVAVACFLMIFLLALLAGFVPLSHPALARRVATEIRNSGADSCSVGKVKVTFWKGASLHDLTVVKKIDTAATVTVVVPRSVIKGNIVKLACGSLRKRALLPAGDGAAPGMPLQAIKGFIAAFLESAGLRKMTVVKARLEIRRNNGPDIEASGVNVEMALAGGEGIRSVRGSLSVGSLRIAGTQAARQLSAEFQGDTSAVTVTLGKGVALDGRVKAECSIDITRARLSAFTLSTKNSDIGMISSWTDTTNGYVTGRADIKLSLDSSALLLDSLHGSGTLQVANASLMRFPFQKTIASMFAFPHFRAPRFSRVEGVFAIKPGGVLSSDMRGAGDTIIVTTSGWIKANGTLSEKITCEFTRAGTKALTPFMRKTLDETRGGGRSVRIRIYGKTDHPKVEIVSKQVLEKAVQNMFDDVKSNLQQWLR